MYGSLALGDAHPGRRRDRRGLVDVRHRDREGLLRKQAAGVGRADADQVAALRLIVEDRRGLERVANERERGVVGRAGAGDERVGKRVASVRIGCGERADDGADGKVLRDGTGGEGDVSRRLVDARHRDRDRLRGRERSIAHLHRDVVDVVNAHIGRGFVIRRCLERENPGARVDRKESLVNAAHDAVGQSGVRIGVGGRDCLHSRLVLRDARCRGRCDRRRLVYVRHRDREGLLREQAAGVGRTNANRETALRLVVKRCRRLKLAANDRERRVVRRTSRTDQRVGERVARVRVTRGKRSDDRCCKLIFSHTRDGQGDVGGRLVAPGDRIDVARKTSRLGAEKHADRVRRRTDYEVRPIIAVHIFNGYVLGPIADTKRLRGLKGSVAVAKQDPNVRGIIGRHDVRPTVAVHIANGNVPLPTAFSKNLRQLKSAITVP